MGYVTMPDNSDLAATAALPRVRAAARRALQASVRARLSADGRSYACESLPGAAAWARRTAAAAALWERLEDAGLVELRAEPEDYWTWDDLEEDTFDVETHESTVPGGARAIEAQRRRYREMVERDGVWRFSSWFRTSPDGKWTCADSVGMVDQDEPYEELRSELQMQAVEQLRSALRDRCPTCRRAG